VNASATARRNREAFGGVYVSGGVAADSETDGSGEESKNCPVGVLSLSRTRGRARSHRSIVRMEGESLHVGFRLGGHSE
jgi:hypothetical protein